MAALHGWQPRLGTGLNIFQNTNNGQSLTLVNTPTEIILEGTAFSPEIMNELEQAIANSEIINFSAAPTASTQGALGQFGAFDGMVYYCTGVSISMSYGALSAGTYYFYAQNLPYSFTLSGASAGLSFNGATLTSGESPIETNCWPQGTQITMVDNSTYQWTALTPASNTIPISDELAQALGLASGATVSDALQKLEGCVYQQSDGILCDALGNPLQKIAIKRTTKELSITVDMGQGETPPSISFNGASGTSAEISPYVGNSGDIQRLNILSGLSIAGMLDANSIYYQCVSSSGYCFGPLTSGADTILGGGLVTVTAFGNLAKIDFGIKITGNGASSSFFEYGLLATVISSALGKSITPISQRFPVTFYRADSIYDAATEFCSYMRGVAAGYWMPGRIYTVDDAYGDWPASTFEAGDRIIGTVYGTIST